MNIGADLEVKDTIVGPYPTISQSIILYISSIHLYLVDY